MYTKALLTLTSLLALSVAAPVQSEVRAEKSSLTHLKARHDATAAFLGAAVTGEALRTSPGVSAIAARQIGAVGSGVIVLSTTPVKKSVKVRSAVVSARQAKFTPVGKISIPQIPKIPKRATLKANLISKRRPQKEISSDAPKESAEEGDNELESDEEFDSDNTQPIARQIGAVGSGATVLSATPVKQSVKVRSAVVSARQFKVTPVGKNSIPKIPKRATLKADFISKRRPQKEISSDAPKESAEEGDNESESDEEFDSDNTQPIAKRQYLSEADEFEAEQSEGSFFNNEADENASSNDAGELEGRQPQSEADEFRAKQSEGSFFNNEADENASSNDAGQLEGRQLQSEDEEFEELISKNTQPIEG